MTPNTFVPLAAAALVLVAPLSSHAALSAYSQNFESLNKASATALSGNGWKYFANVFDGSTYLYGYGPGGAPNNTGGFSAVASGQGGAPQGQQQLSVYSDYNNQTAHGSGQLIEALVFQERTIGAGDAGQWDFGFDAKLGNLAAPTTAYAFIKTLNPAAGYATTNEITVNMTSISKTSWEGHLLSLNVDSKLTGQLLQFGFANRATRNAGSGVFYDNISFATAPVPEPATYALMFAGLGLVGAVARRRAAAARG